MLRALWPTYRQPYASPAVRLGRALHIAGLLGALLLLLALLSNGGFGLIHVLLPALVYAPGRFMLYLLAGE